MGILRLFLAYIVLLSHCPPGTILHKLSHPALAVQCFYAISGFYMQFLINQYQNAKTHWAIAFLKSRIIRIFPAYFIFLTLTIVCMPSRLDFFYNLELKQQILVVISNLFIVSQDILVFFKMPGAIMGQSWTLSLELAFYFSAIYLLVKQTRTLLLIITASIILRFLLRDYGLYLDPWLYRLLPVEIGIFLSGSLMYRFYEKYLISQSEAINSVLKIVGGLALFYLIYFMIKGWHLIPGGQWDAQASFGVPYKYWACLILTILFIPFIFKFSKDLRIDRHIGDLSYPLYIGHFFFIYLLEDQLPPEYFNLAILVLTLLSSIVIVYFVELPLAKVRENLRTKNVPQQDYSESDLVVKAST